MDTGGDFALHDPPISEPPMPDSVFRAPEHTVPLPWDRLAAHLRGHGMTLELDQPPRQFAGGMGNLNYLLRIDGAPSVLRRPPLGPLPPGANDMRREHRVLSRLWRAFPPAPQSVHYCADEAVLGAHFLIMEYREGRTIRGSRWPAAIAGDNEATRAVSALLVRTLAELHAVDAAAIGLGDFGRPEGFLGRAVEGWAGRAAIAADGEPAPPTGEVVRWLRDNLVPGGAPSVLHNDFKLDNMLWAPDDWTRRVAVLDWDQATRGDPLFDLATLLSYWTEPGDSEAMVILDQMPTGTPGSMTRAEARDLYAALTGRDLGDFRFHRVLGMFKLAVVFVQLHAQYRRGTVSDPKYAPFEAAGYGIMAMAHEVAQGRAD
jgi:aminoglycoside phosphotransferase (APT) family kinase protein